MPKSTIKQFGYDLSTRTADHRIPMHPFVRLCLEHWGETLDPSGAPVISAHMMTEQEIETHILNLKADLDRVGAEAKRTLHKAVVAHRTDPSKY